MISIILLGNFGTEKTLAEIFAAVGNQTNVEVILIAKERPLSAQSPYKFIPTGESSMSSCISLATGMASGETVLFLDTRASVEKGSIQNLISSLDTSNAVTWFTVETDSDSIELEDNSPEGILRALTNDTVFPTAAVAIKSTLLPKNDMPEGENAAEIITKLMVEAIGAQETASRGSLSVTAPRETCTLSDKARGLCLKSLVNVANIEDLFPHHDWNTHEKESAAASYHTLAALFIRLGDSESAMECLRLSDQLEDSPRSLALKGLIALDRGEILGAVANMVSSLQQYELRKKENDIHYSRFQPQNLEIINENLNAGLQALNKRDNQRALNHFAEAVFNFDSFYGELGEARVRE